MTNEQIQALKAAAENIDRGAVLDLWLRIAEVLNRGHKKVETALLTEAHAAMSEMLDLDKYFILSLLAERDADKALIAEQTKRIAELEVRPVVPLNFSESEDADFCREWAWSEIKKELNTDHWNSQDNGNFYGFYLMGWHARRQFNEQRRAENLQIAKEVGLVRTLTVKLPDCDYGAVQHMSGGSGDYCSGFVDGTQNAIKRVKSDCAAAGITLVVGK